MLLRIEKISNFFGYKGASIQIGMICSFDCLAITCYHFQFRTFGSNCLSERSACSDLRKGLETDGNKVKARFRKQIVGSHLEVGTQKAGRCPRATLRNKSLEAGPRLVCSLWNTQQINRMLQSKLAEPKLLVSSLVENLR